MRNNYIGVEQEFTSYLDGKQVSASKHFLNVLEYEKPYFKKSSTSIRTRTGHAIYCDGSELEVVTPPIRLNKGFATRLTDITMIGRNKVVESLPNLTHTGLSMHWNLTDIPDANNFYQNLIIPFHLFGISPLSMALNMRLKPKRFEFLGDYLTHENQINATALLLGAYHHTQVHVKERVPPPLPNILKVAASTRLKVYLRDGRYSPIDPQDPKSITAQEYLEQFYQWIRPSVFQLATTSEIENLESFISGKNKLEYDHLNYFAYMQVRGLKDGGAYFPLAIGNRNYPEKVVYASPQERELPLEGKLLGSFIESSLGLSELDWDHLRLGSRSSSSRQADSIDQIYDLARELQPSLPKLDRSVNGATITLKKKHKNKIRGPRHYDPSKDVFQRPKSEYMYLLAGEVGKTLVSKKFFWSLLGASALGASLLWVGANELKKEAHEKALQQINELNQTNLRDARK